MEGEKNVKKRTLLEQAKRIIKICLGIAFVFLFTNDTLILVANPAPRSAMQDGYCPPKIAPKQQNFGNYRYFVVKVLT